MALSRYRNVSILNGKKFFSTSELPDQELLDTIPTFQVAVSRFDRLDILAFKHLGAGEYWWIIALFNNLDWAYAIEEGQILKIPTDVQEVLRLI